MSDDVKKALEELERGPGCSQWHTDVIRHHLDGEPERLAAAREEQREADARGCEDGEVCRCDSIDSDAQCGHCLGEAFAATVRATPLTATPLGDELAQVRRERDALKVRALGAEARVMELEEEQEARDDVMTAEQRLKFWEENPHACPVHFGARTACGQCHDSTAQQLTNLRIEHEAVVNEVETAEARVKELLALGEQRCDGIGCDWGEECVRLVAERDALKARVRKLEAELDEGVRVLMGVLSSPGFVDLAQSDRDALKTFLAKASTALKEGAR